VKDANYTQIEIKLLVYQAAKMAQFLVGFHINHVLTAPQINLQMIIIQSALTSAPMALLARTHNAFDAQMNSIQIPSTTTVLIIQVASVSEKAIT